MEDVRMEGETPPIKDRGDGPGPSPILSWKHSHFGKPRKDVREGALS